MNILILFLLNMSDFNEKQLLVDIDQLRGHFPQTQDLYREVCILLFFRYGITPTTNKLYQLVRKGSMSAPAEALARFWEDLRAKSRVRIEHPDLPESLKNAAGEMVGTLWSSALALAQEELAAMRSDAKERVEAAKQAQAAAETERDSARNSHELVSQTLEFAHARVSELEQVVAASRATISALEAQLQNARGENVGLLQKIEEARRDFGSELEKLRSAASLAEERFRASETRALLEIDRERTAAAKMQKELEAYRAAADQMTERHRAEVATLQEQLGSFRQRAGELEGNLKAVTANRDLVLDDLKALRTLLEDKNAKISQFESESAELRGQLEQARRTIEDLLKVAKTTRTSRKPKTT